MTVSVLLSIFQGDAPAYLDGALESICTRQSLVPNQIVLVKDGPLTAALDQVVERWADELKPFLSVVALEKNMGLAEALNAGLEHCEHEFVARIDADDICFPERFERQASFLRANPEVDILGTGAIEIDDAGTEGAIRNVPEFHDDIMAHLWTCPIIHPSVMFRRDRILELGGYDVSLRRRQDYELWFRAAERGLRFANLNEPLLYYRFNRDTHHKQPPQVAWEQAMIGFRGSSRLGLSWWKRVGCFVPFVRALLPSWAQHTAYRALRPFDPRRR